MYKRHGMLNEILPIIKLLIVASQDFPDKLVMFKS